ncbi:ATP-binding protein, partial [Intrasporangium chromatireducens Q5-1]
CTSVDRECTSGGTERARVILVMGPSGSGKSRLSARLNSAYGWPIVRLDDFYREVDDPALPRSSLGIPDWDHPDSWNAEAAISALRTLVDEGRVDLPHYDIASSRVTGTHTVTARPQDRILAEGLFAGRLAARLRAEGLLAEALCVRRNRWVTFGLRLARDLSERRKAPHILVRRGLRLLRDEPRVVAEARVVGAVPVRPKRAESILAAHLPRR